MSARPDLPGRSARLVAAYGFEETSGNTTPDASGGRHPGILVDAVVTGGRVGKALDLDGTTGHLRIDEPGWPGGDYTYVVWVWPRTVRDWQTILEIQTPSSRGVELAIAPGGRLEVWSSGLRRLKHGVTLAPETWTHVALTRAGRLLTVLVSGVPQRAGRDRTVFDFGRCPALVGVDADLGCAGKLNGFFGGLLDELRVYDCALSADGIRSMMNVAVEPVPGPPDRPIAATGQPGPRDHDVPDTPPRFDMWLAAELAALLTRSPSVDLFVGQGVGYGVLGGVGYAAVVFLFWMRGAQPGLQALRRRTLTLVLGSLLAALLTLLESRVVSWPPPSAHPELAGLYPADFPVNLNENSFPSQSTALYAAAAGGIYSVGRRLGMWAWFGVGVLVALPRMYLGGHYLTDVLAGLVAGLAGYGIAAGLLQANVVSWGETVFEREWGDWRRTLAECVVFLWILQIATEFSHVVWITNALVSLWK